MFWPPKMSVFPSKWLLYNSASFTSWRIKDLCQKWKVKLIFRGGWNSLMAWPDWPPLLYGRFTPLSLYITAHASSKTPLRFHCSTDTGENGFVLCFPVPLCAYRLLSVCTISVKVKKGKASSLDIAPLTILKSGTLQPRKWQLTCNDCSTAAHAVAAQSPR